MRTMRCECGICKLLRAIEPLRKKATPAQAKALETVLLRWEAATTEAAFWKLKFNGKWPE